MSIRNKRIGAGPLLDMGSPVTFTFNGKPIHGYRGDTVASALLANGHSMMGRSFKYHRPRGLFTAGVEEPNALVTTGKRGRTTPNERATVQEIYEGLETRSQNHWPMLGADIGVVNDFLSPVLVAGFYYKTFMEFGLKGWMQFEKVIRRAAGLGTAARGSDADRYEKMNAFADVVVVGGGVTGLIAAVNAARAGLDVLLVEQNAHFGGQLLADDPQLNGETAAEWIATMIAELKARPNAEIMNRTTAYGYYDGNMLAMLERVTDHIDPTQAGDLPRQRQWTVRAKKVVLATGALERPVLFKNNDRPGVMLAGAVRAYLRQFGVSPGQVTVCVGNDDSIYETAVAVVENGGSAKVVDLREATPLRLQVLCDRLGIACFAGAVPLSANGRRKVSAFSFRQGNGKPLELPCDLLAVSGGWTPTVHLASQAGAKPVFDAFSQAFVSGQAREDFKCAGAVTGRWSLTACLQSAARVSQAVIAELEASVIGAYHQPQVATRIPERSGPAEPLDRLQLASKDKVFIDYQHDVTAKDIALASREGFISVEHMKRYTTLGMATDQGKTSNLLGLSILAAERGVDVAAVGTTTFRSPYTPVTVGALAGEETGQLWRPIRRTALHQWHADQGAVFTDAGAWHRPRYYPAFDGETLGEAYVREADHVRNQVGLCDVTTLGKIEVVGPDAAQFLDRIYANMMSNLKVGRARYGAMVREDGIAFDDGTVTRLAEDRFFVTTTTGEAGHVMHWLEYFLDVVWPELKVQVASVTDQWTAIAIAGPKARNLLASVCPDDLSNDALPFMGMIETQLCGLPVRLFRISFSGELAFEAATPCRNGRALWEGLMEAGEPFGAAPYGLEALGALRIEKGFITHSEMDGTRTLDDIGLSWMASKKKDYVGKPMQDRPGLVDGDRPKLVGVIPVDPKAPLRAGGHFLDRDSIDGADLDNRMDSLGHVTSFTYSPALESNIALGLIRGGEAVWEGKQIWVADPLAGEHMAVKIVSPLLFDPTSSRMKG